MITLDLSILNQKGTPMFYSDVLAARPNFGIVGRIFIAIDSPYGIYRDTGSAWDQIAGSGGGGITGSGTINTIALFTPTGTAIGDSAITQTASNITVTARNLIVTNGAFTLSHTHNPVNGTFNPYGEQIAVTNTINAGVTWTALLAFFNTSSLQNNQWNGSVSFGNGSYTTNNLNLSPITFNAAGATITSTQASGGIRVWANQILQLRIDGTNNGTYTHYANSVIYGDFAASTARFTITNRYGYLVNNLDEYSAGHTYTNRWAFYNAGINDNNFFAGKVGIGSGYTPSTYQFDVIGSTRIQGDLLVSASNILTTRFLNINSSLGASRIEYSYSGSTLLQLGRMQGTASLTRQFDLLSKTPDFGSTSQQILTLFPSVSIKYDNSAATASTIATETASACFEIFSINKGFLPPRMNTAQKNAIASPVAGLILYDTTLNKLCVYTTAWETVTSI
jgi:hypothetical protein